MQTKLDVMINAHPHNEHVKKLIERFEKIVRSRKTRVWLAPDTPRKKNVRGPHVSQHHSAKLRK
ncbi:hypothetical protein Hanom_Chr12g01170831 [Helianthus anomalus]